MTLAPEGIWNLSWEREEDLGAKPVEKVGQEVVGMDRAGDRDSGLVAFRDKA